MSDTKTESLISPKLFPRSDPWISISVPPATGPANGHTFRHVINEASSSFLSTWIDNTTLC